MLCCAVRGQTRRYYAPAGLRWWKSPSEPGKKACPSWLLRVVYQEYTVAGVQHQHLLLEGGERLQSSLLARQLAPATKVIVLLATIGDGLEERVSKIWDADMVYALALDGAGSGAVEALANAACQYFEKKALGEGLQASIPFSPGMVDWSVADGQPQIFNLLGEAGSIVSLTPSFIMIPRKSLTMVMGLGANLDSSGRTCDFCSMRATCRYQEQYLQ